MIEQLRQIAIFAKTVDHGSFRGAAKELKLSPSVVSHHISQLEEQLGVALLYRSTRKLALTPEGARLLSAAQEMLAAIDGGLADISNSVSKSTGQLRVTLPSVLAESRLTKSIADFSTMHPAIKLSLNFTDMREELIEGGYDVAIRMGLNKKRSPSAKTLFHAKRYLVASQSYLANRPEVTSPEDVADWDWLEFSPVHHIKPHFVKDGHKPIILKTNVKISVNDARALHHLVRSGAGVAVLPELLMEDDIHAGLVTVVLPDWKLYEIDVFAEWPSNAPRKGLIRLLIDKLSNDLSGE